MKVEDQAAWKQSDQKASTSQYGDLGHFSLQLVIFQEENLDTQRKMTGVDIENQVYGTAFYQI